MKTKLYVKKSLSVIMAVLMLMSAWVFVPGEHNHASAYPESAATVAGTNTTAVSGFSDSDFTKSITTVSGNFHGDNASTMASRGYYKNTLYSPHFPASNNNLNNSDAGVYFGTLGSTADGARVWYPETTLIYDGGTTPQIPILFDIDSNSSNRVGVKNVYISSGANGLTFKDSYWTAKSTASSTNYYTHFTFDWIMQNNSGNYWISTSSGNDKESMCSSNGGWDIYGTYLQYTGGTFGSGSTYYKAITPTWVCRTGSNYTGTTNKTIYVIDYYPIKDALNNVKNKINDIKANPAKYTTGSVAALVAAANKLIAAHPNSYITASDNQVVAWNKAASEAMTAYNSAKNLEVQKYRVTFKYKDGTEKFYTRDYGSSVDCAAFAANHVNTIEQGNVSGHQTYSWDTSKYVSTVVDDVTITEVASGLVAHSWTAYTQGDTTHSRNCTVCGYVDSQPHVEDNGTVDKEETCTENGSESFDCKVCGKQDIRTSVIDKIAGHEFTGGYAIKEDGKDGTHHRKCIRCDAYGFGVTEGGCEAHDFDKNNDGKVDALDGKVINAADCLTKGERKYTCENCTAAYTEAIPATGHNNVTATAGKDVTTICGGDGYAAFWSCADCGKIYKDAACTDEIKEYKYTTVDGVQVPSELVTKGPAHEFTGAFVPATPGKDGTHVRQCRRYTICATVSEEMPHSWGAPEVTDATCLKEGKEVYTCKDCGQTYTETLSKASHNMKEISAVEAVCGKKGNNKYYKCLTCSNFYKDEEGTTETTAAAEEIKALEHKWSVHHSYDTLKTPATCQSAAVYNNHCDYCEVEIVGTEHSYGARDTENGHKFNGELQQNADGTHSYKCLVAGCEEYGAATTCDFSNVKKDVASTCHTIGYIVYECATCGAEKRVNKTDFDFTNHDGEEEVRGATSATCTQQGYSGDVYCLSCNTVKSSGTETGVDSAKHENMRTYEAQASTCQKDGWKAYRYCDACKTYETEKVIVPVKAHKFTIYTTNNNGTHTAICDTCKAEDGEIATDTKNCSGGTANCVEAKLCEVCEASYGDVDANNHKTVTTIAKVSATCQKEGTEAYRYCEACKKAVDEIKSIAMLEHQYSPWAKVDGKDEHTRYCTTCVESVAPVATQTEACSGGTAYCNKLAKCSVCKTEYGQRNAANHSTEAYTITNESEATCQAPGYTGDKLYKCCGELKEAGEEIAQLAHTYSIEVEGSRVPATCLDKGEVTYKCSTCVEGAAATEKRELAVNPKNHALTETVTVNAVEATCESDGHTGDIYYACCYDAEKTAAENKNALKEKGTVIKANGQHIYGTAVPEYMISEIIDTAEGAKEIVLVDEEPSYNDKVAARRENGKWYHVTICTICDEVVYTACYTYEHTYNCVDTDECEVCSGLCSLVDEKKHDTLVEIPRVDATHTTDGTKAYYQCEDCGLYFLDDAGKKGFDPESEEGKALINITKDTVPCTAWEEEPYETADPACGIDGYKKYRCATEGCDKVKTEIIPATSESHTWSTEYKEIKAPTCASVGYETLYCTSCETYKPNSTKPIAATGDHNYDANGDGTTDRNDAVIVDGINCQTPGTLTYTCTVCGNTNVETDNEGVSAHTWGNWEAVSGDCSTGILQERICSTCNAKETQRITTDTHEFQLLIEILPTAQADGYRIEKCANCGLENRTELPYEGGDEGGNEGGETPDVPEAPEADKHIVDENIYEVHDKADCRHGEIRRYTCIVCGEMVEREVGNPTEHIWMTQAAEKATCTRAGHSEYKRCLICLKEDGKIDYNPLQHTDGNNDGKCDNCEGMFYTEGSGTQICNCSCHNDGGFAGIIYKIIRFFWKLFGIKKVCECGVVHY